MQKQWPTAKRQLSLRHYKRRIKNMLHLFNFNHGIDNNGVALLCLVDNNGVALLCLVGNNGVPLLCLVNNNGVALLCLVDNNGVALLCLVDNTGVALLCFLHNVNYTHRNKIYIYAVRFY